MSVRLPSRSSQRGELLIDPAEVTTARAKISRFRMADNSMIRYALACDKGHAFESWFANSATYDRQVKRGLVSCPVCNSTKVEKAIMAPRVAGTKRRDDASVSAAMPEGPGSSQPSASKAPPNPVRHKRKEEPRRPSQRTKAPRIAMLCGKGGSVPLHYPRPDGGSWL
jgi:uncharacterized protein DUF1178